MPRLTNGACSYGSKGNPRLDELLETARACRFGVARCASAARSVSRSPGAGEREVLAPKTSRGRPRPPTESRLTTPRIFACPCCSAANRAAPRAPSAAPSVERKTSVYGTLTRWAAAVRRVGARQLDERRSARGVVVQSVARTAVVAVRHDDDLGRRDTDALLRRDEVDQARAAAVDRGRERFAPHLEAVRP